MEEEKREGKAEEEDVGFCHLEVQLKSAGNSSRDIKVMG